MIKNHPLCPKKHPLVVRNSKYGKFFGCLTYPNHKIVVERPDCPKGHIMMLRKGPYGEFFGCINYPNCEETYDFEVKDKRYHAKLWEEFNKSKYFKEKKDEYNQENNIASKVSKRNANQFVNYQNKYQREASEYKNRIKPKRWWKLTDKIQSFRLNQKQKYSKPIRFNIPDLLPDLLPSVLDFTVGSKEYHQQQFKQCLKQIKGITILTREPPIEMLATLEDYFIHLEYLF